MKRFYTIQIAPDGPGKVWTFRIAKAYMRVLAFFIVCIFIAGGVALWKLAEINAVLLSSRFLKQANEKLLEKHKEYEGAFAELDSIYSMESQIHNILQTYLDNDSSKTQSLLDRNSFSHISSEKTRLHLDRIYEDQQDKVSKDDYIPSIVPVVGVVSKVFDNASRHFGVDFAAIEGEPVFATAYGYVLSTSPQGSLGLTVVLDHHNGYQTTYSHLGGVHVRKGDFVRKGETIGTVGMTGNTTGPHLHYQINKDGKPVDPSPFLHDE